MQKRSAATITNFTKEDRTTWYLFWFAGILLMCALSTLAPVWLESRQK